MTTDVGCETCRWVVPSAMTGWPAWMPRVAFRPVAQGARGDVLLVIFLRGAADCLNVVVPHGEDAYYRLRPSLSIPRPHDPRAPLARRALDLAGFFGVLSAWARILPSRPAGPARPPRAVRWGGRPFRSSRPSRHWRPPDAGHARRRSTRRATSAWGCGRGGRWFWPAAAWGG